MTRLLVLGLDQDDALACAITDQLILAHRAVGSRIELVWPTAFDRISGSEPPVPVGTRAELGRAGRVRRGLPPHERREEHRLERLVNPERNAVVQTAAYFASVGLAMALTAVLVGIRTWRRLTTPTDETGD